MKTGIRFLQLSIASVKERGDMVMCSQGIIKRLSVLCFIIIFFGGCATGPQFIPKHLENSQVGELSELRITNLTKDVYIDGEEAKSNIVYLAPGKHSIKYKILGENRAWREWAENIKKQPGWQLSADGQSAEKYPYTITCVYPRYVWKEESTDVFLKGGMQYFLNSLLLK